MGEAYFNLKLKLEELGYNNTLPIDAVPLVECILADLMQTTRSLQHYMDLSKEALIQRDALMLEAEPYRCDNAKLIQDNNLLYRDIMELKEENFKISKECKRKIKALSEELMKKDNLISKLQHDLRDLSLRGICAETQSSRNKSRRKDAGDTSAHKICICMDKNVCKLEKEIVDLTKTVHALEEKNTSYQDEISLLKSQVEHRDNEVIRLNILLEGGRPLNSVTKDACNKHSDGKIQELMKKICEAESANEFLKNEIDKGLDKQHEAMLRALGLADKNKILHEELQKVDSLALKVEEDCNKRLSALINDNKSLQSKIDTLTLKNAELERQQSNEHAQNLPKLHSIQESLNKALKEKDGLQKEINDLVELNKSLQEQVQAFSKRHEKEKCRETPVSTKCPTKDELQLLLGEQKSNYEKHIIDIEKKLTETINLFHNHLLTCSKQRDKSPKGRSTYRESSIFVKDLHNKLCEKEQKILMLKKEIDEYKSKVLSQEHNNQENYKDIISQLNTENSELSKENISLSQQLSQYKNLGKFSDRGDYCNKDTKFKEEIENLRQEIYILRKDKQEYNSRLRETVELVERLKRDLTFKEKEIERIQDENSSYKITSRTGKASTDHLKDECNFLREQIKRMQSDIIKEKTLASQMKNIQLETERSSNELQNELLCIQKKLNLSKDANESLERKCKELQSEIMTLKNDKTNILDNFKKVDQERDKLVLELDHKAETISVLEQKLKSQTYEISNLETEISELKRKLSINKVAEHKIDDYETQIAFLNGEILRLTQQYDSAIIENKQLQNNLADVNGTLKLTKMEYEKSRKEVDGLKQQLQHYVAEVRRIEELMSKKEAERSDMLEHFASLSVEANILENTNHSLESESASKSLQLQTYITQVQDLESKLLDKETIIDNQSSRIASMMCKITSLENEIKLITEEKAILQQNVSYLKKMCSNLQTEQSHMSTAIGDTDSELKLYENKIKSLSNTKRTLVMEKEEMKENLETTEKLLSNARKEIIELKLALQDATSETKSLHERVGRLTRRESEIHEVIFLNL